MAAVSLPLSLWLRMGASIETIPETFILQSTALFAVTAAAVFWPMGLYRGIWRYASMNDLIQITKAVSLAVLIFLPILFITSRAEFLPRSLPTLATAYPRRSRTHEDPEVGLGIAFAEVGPDTFRDAVRDLGPVFRQGGEHEPTGFLAFDDFFGCLGTHGVPPFVGGRPGEPDS